MDKNKPVIIQGVVAMLLDKEGDVVCSAEDFSKSGYGGFELHEAQKIRCKERLRFKSIQAYASPALTSTLETTTYNRIFDDMLKGGFRVHYEYIRTEQK